MKTLFWFCLALLFLAIAAVLDSWALWKCRLSHRRHFKLTPISYSGGYLVDCCKCHQQFTVQR